RLLADHEAVDPANRTRQFYDEAITLLLAGHETTANALAFTLHLLGRHSSITAKLREETRAVLKGRPAEIGDLPKLSYTRMVLDEAMRLYPPAWIIDRNCTEDDEIAGVAIPKGSLLFLSPYVTHRHPEFWPDAERFEPLRFEKAKAADRPRHAYFPFGVGPRVCVGMGFALTEAVLVLATLIDCFDVEPVSGHVLKLEPNITLRPKNGLPMTVRAI
ncbi:MAG: cytochrome P450, partial [Geminicoccaceae bacterium]